MAIPKGLPPPNIPWIEKDGKPSLAFRPLKTMMDGLILGFFGAATFLQQTPPATPGTLINAANDAAAAAAGVAVGQFYRNGSVVQIRVT
jgi:hypothetical protein